MSGRRGPVNDRIPIGRPFGGGVRVVVGVAVGVAVGVCVGFAVGRDVGFDVGCVFADGLVVITGLTLGLGTGGGMKVSVDLT